MLKMNIHWRLRTAIITVSITFQVHCDVTKIMYQQQANQRFTNISQTENSTSVLSCGRQCSRKDWCKSFNFNFINQSCQFGYLTTGDDDQAVMETDWELYTIKEVELVTTVTECLSEWQKFGSACYFLDNTIRSQADAQTNCTSLMSTAHLVDIKSGEEQEFVNSIINNTMHIAFSVWIGGKYNVSSGKYHWSDTSVLDDGFSFWGPSEPTHLDEHCIVLGKEYGYGWVDIDCDVLKASICEYEIL